MTEGSSPASPASMIERLARAIGVPEQSGLVCEWSLNAARAAIEAVRKHLTDGHETTSEYWPTIEMIDAALK